VKRIDKIVGRDERSWEQFWCSPNNIHLIFIGVLGNLIIVSRQTKKLLKVLHVSEEISSVTFNNDGNIMYVLTINGLVYMFSLKTFQCIDQITLLGIVKATSIAIYAPLSLIAIGCNSGVVSLYSYNLMHNDENSKNFGLLVDNNTNNNNNKILTPLYSVENLLTAITGISFNHDGQLLVIYSRLKPESIRLVHVTSGRVFANWPKQNRLGYVQTCCFSPHSGYLVLGNDFGYARLIRLQLYSEC